jgi:glucosamine 6-phosphate synthetase-like amidotransferase/phosphosugar isomerase protein
MYDELEMAPDAIASYLAPDEDEQAHRNTLAQKIASARRIWLTGCGTAYHAALAGRALLTELTDGSVDARAVEAFELAHYERDAPREGDVTIALSHSGRPTATNAALSRARSGGSYGITVTGFADSPAAQNTDSVLNTGYAAAQSMAYTISYSLMLAALADLAVRVTKSSESTSGSDIIASLNEVPALHRQVLGMSPVIREHARRLSGWRRWMFAGAGPEYATSLEAALKMQETNYTASIGLHMEELLHGPVATLGDSVLVVIAPPGPGRDRALDLLQAARMVGAESVAIGEQDDAQLAQAGAFVGLPSVPAALSPLLYHVPVHLFSYWLAVETETNPDVMRRDDGRYLAARQSYTL